MRLKSCHSLLVSASISGTHMIVRLGYLCDGGISCIPDLKGCLGFYQRFVNFWMTATSHQDYTMDVLLELVIPVVKIIAEIWHISKHASLVGTVANVVVAVELKDQRSGVSNNFSPHDTL